MENVTIYTGINKALEKENFINSKLQNFINTLEMYIYDSDINVILEEIKSKITADQISLSYEKESSNKFKLNILKEVKVGLSKYVRPILKGDLIVNIPDDISVETEPSALTFKIAKFDNTGYPYEIKEYTLFDKDCRNDLIDLRNKRGILYITNGEVTLKLPLDYFAIG